MSYTNAKALNTDGYGVGMLAKVASNSLNVAEGSMVSLSGGFVIQAGAT